jgi:hypothetical protein
MLAGFAASWASLPWGLNDHYREALMAETAIQFLAHWRETYVYAEPRALEQLDEIVTECIADAAEAGISADDLEKAAGSKQRAYSRAASMLLP